MGSRKPRIVVVGSANVDLTTFTDAFPRPGETIFGKRFVLGFGGKGANQAVAAALCGARVDIVARVGDDLFGEATIDNLDRYGVGTKHVKVVRGVSSGVAPIFVDATGQNRIIVVKGANDRLTTKAVGKAQKLLKRASLIVLQFEIPVSTIAFTLRIAHKHRIPVILNPAPAASFDPALLKGLRYLIPNETEAAALSGQPATSPSEADAAGKALRKHGVDRVIITLGEQGAVVVGEADTEHYRAHRVASVDTSGAGDAFIGSLAAFLAEGQGERLAVRRASLYAALSTTEVGTQKSFLKRSRFEKEWKRCAKQPNFG